MDVQLCNAVTGRFRSVDPLQVEIATHNYPTDPANSLDLDGRFCLHGGGDGDGKSSSVDTRSRRPGNRTETRHARATTEPGPQIRTRVQNRDKNVSLGSREAARS